MTSVRWDMGVISATAEGIDFTMVPRRGRQVHELFPWCKVANMVVDGDTMVIGLTDAPERRWPGCADADEVAAFTALLRSRGVSERSRRTSLVKVYGSQNELLKDAKEMQAQGWRSIHQESDRRRVAKGRTAAKGIAFLPWAFLSPARSRPSSTTVTWVRD